MPGSRGIRSWWPQRRASSLSSCKRLPKVWSGRTDRTALLTFPMLTETSSSVASSMPTCASASYPRPTGKWSRARQTKTAPRPSRPPRRLGRGASRTWGGRSPLSRRTSAPSASATPWRSSAARPAPSASAGSSRRSSARRPSGAPRGRKKRWRGGGPRWRCRLRRPLQPQCRPRLRSRRAARTRYRPTPCQTPQTEPLPR
mmetsp:Transcript_136783/g.354771  ORF Transcript_136783/g.354771 Transcript_136783/m.354771 type:complete len:201 (-) Transcript_136783:1190-1792(-)